MEKSHNKIPEYLRFSYNLSIPTLFKNQEWINDFIRIMQSRIPESTFIRYYPDFLGIRDPVINIGGFGIKRMYFQLRADGNIIKWHKGKREKLEFVKTIGEAINALTEIIPVHLAYLRLTED